MCQTDKSCTFQNSLFYGVWTVPVLLLRQRKVYDMTLWIIYPTSTHPKHSKNVHVYCIIPSSLFTTISFKWEKTVHLQEPSASFCGILNELKCMHIGHCARIALVQLVSLPTGVRTATQRIKWQEEYHRRCRWVAFLCLMTS